MAASDKPQQHLDTISNDIDILIQRYLLLSDQYNTLRSQLNTTQSSFYQHLSRANLAPDRGIASYGADRYDERMQASRLCRIKGAEDESRGNISLPGPSWNIEIEEQQEEKKAGAKDPISMFAVLPPQSLRAAQKDAVGMVGLIPRVLEVQKEMGEIEIRVRRGRKYLTKFQEADDSLDGSHNEAKKVDRFESKDMRKELDALGGTSQSSQAITG